MFVDSLRMVAKGSPKHIILCDKRARICVRWAPIQIRGFMWQTGTLVSGTRDLNLRCPSSVILSHMGVVVLEFLPLCCCPTCSESHKNSMSIRRCISAGHLHEPPETGFEHP